MVGITSEAPKVYRGKVLVVGESCVGKTSIVSVLTKDASNFPRNYNMTTGIELSSKQFSLPNSSDSVEFLFIDCTGHHLYEDLLKKSSPQNCLLCLVYDMTNKASFEKLNEWIEKTLASTQKGLPGLLLANKVDLASRRFVTTSMGKEFAQRRHLLYFECSAKENIDLHEAFRALAVEWNKKPKL